MQVASRAYGSASVPIHDGDLIALYTDGLVERRGEFLDDGIARLARRLSNDCDRDRDDLHEWCSEVVADLAGPNPPDDVALLLVRYRRDR
jgi:hypothetical protein